MTSVPTPTDRRANRRYAVRTPLRYRPANSPLNAAWKYGRTLDMSAGGILTDLPEAIAPGAKLELAMDWTGLYHDRNMMRLYLIASVKRADGRGTALRILRYKFRDVRSTAVRPQSAEKRRAAG